MDQLTVSKQWKLQAEEILKLSGLLAALNSFGIVIFTGSYKLDLMMSGDIDIYLKVTGNPKELAPQLLSATMSNDFWNYYMIHDWLHFKHQDFPNEYYLGLQRKDYAGNPWKADIWIFNEIPEQLIDYMTQLEKKLTPENRVTILTLKEEAKKKDSKFPSTAIYEAVVTNGVTSLEEIKV